MTINPSWQFLVAFLALVALTMVISRVGRLGIGRASAVASVRAMIQLAVVSLILVYALQHLWAAVGFTLPGAPGWAGPGRGRRSRWPRGSCRCW